MGDLEIVTTSDRPDLDDEARAAFRQNWPEFIFHDPVSGEYIGLVESYFPFYDVLLLDDGKVVAQRTRGLGAGGHALHHGGRRPARPAGRRPGWPGAHRAPGSARRYDPGPRAGLDDHQGAPSRSGRNGPRWPFPNPARTWSPRLSIWSASIARPTAVSTARPTCGCAIGRRRTRSGNRLTARRSVSTKLRWCDWLGF